MGASSKPQVQNGKICFQTSILAGWRASGKSLSITKSGRRARQSRQKRFRWYGTIGWRITQHMGKFYDIMVYRGWFPNNEDLSLIYSERGKPQSFRIISKTRLAVSTLFAVLRATRIWRFYPQPSPNLRLQSMSWNLYILASFWPWATIVRTKTFSRMWTPFQCLQRLHAQLVQKAPKHNSL